MFMGLIKTCTICKENTREYYTMCCGQSYHPKCLYNWLNVRNVCPITKRKVESHIKPVLKNIINNTSEVGNKLLWDLVYHNKRTFCSICFFPVYENISCNGWRYHARCIKDFQKCPECQTKIKNYNMFRLWDNMIKGKIFHENYLDHTNNSTVGGDIHIDFYAMQRIKRRNTIYIDTAESE